MTVSSTVNKSTYTADGTTTVYAYVWLLPADSDMLVFYDGLPQLSGWTVTGAGNPSGGDVTFTTAPPNGVELVLIRSVEQNQQMDLRPYDPFPAETVEGAFDKLTLICQDMQEQLDRSLKSGPGQENPDDIIEEMVELRDECAASASAAAISETNAANSASAASGSASAAATSAQEAADSAAAANPENPRWAIFQGHRAQGTWETIGVGLIGIIGATITNRGGFTHTDQVGASGNSVRVPKEGWYRVTNRVTYDAGHSPGGNLAIGRGDGTPPSIADVLIPAAGVASTEASELVYLNANEQLFYAITVAQVRVFTSKLTMVTLEYLGTNP